VGCVFGLSQNSGVPPHSKAIDMPNCFITLFNGTAWLCRARIPFSRSTSGFLHESIAHSQVTTDERSSGQLPSPIIGGSLPKRTRGEKVWSRLGTRLRSGSLGLFHS